MKIDKSTILDLLKQQGKHDQVDAAEKDLPDTVDTDQHAGLLSKFGIDLSDLAGKLPGGLGDKLDDLPGGLGKKLDDIL
jgi:hypothetical protein